MSHSHMLHELKYRLQEFLAFVGVVLICFFLFQAYVFVTEGQAVFAFLGSVEPVILLLVLGFGCLFLFLGPFYDTQMFWYLFTWAGVIATAFAWFYTAKFLVEGMPEESLLFVLAAAYSFVGPLWVMVGRHYFKEA